MVMMRLRVMMIRMLMLMIIMVLSAYLKHYPQEGQSILLPVPLCDVSKSKQKEVLLKSGQC